MCTKLPEDYDLFVVDLFMEAMYALHTTYECEFTPADSEADQIVSRKKALETEFLAIEQTTAAKLKKPNWDDDGVEHTCEFFDFKSYHPFVDGQTLKDELIKYGEMVVTKVVHALTSMYVQTNHQMIPPYLAHFFGACYDSCSCATPKMNMVSLSTVGAQPALASRRRRARAWRALPYPEA